MNAQTNIPRFNAMAAYEAERDENRRLYTLLNKCLHLADSMATKLERHGEDASVYRRFIINARREALEDIAA